MRSNLFRASAVALAGILLFAATGPALARAEKAKSQRSLDLLGDKFKKDREQDKKGPILSEDEKQAVAYQKGTVAITAWAPLVKIIKDRKAESKLRDLNTSAILGRLRMEKDRGTDSRILSAIKKQIADEIVELIMAEDSMGQTTAHRLLSGWWQNSGINTKPGQSKRARRKAYTAWKKQLN